MSRPEVTGKKLGHRRRSQAPLHFADPDADAATVRHDERALRLLTFKELKARKGVPYSRSQIRRMEQARTFPLHVVLGEGDGALIAWVEHEIDQYIVEKMAARELAPVGTSEITTTTTRKTPTPEEEVRAQSKTHRKRDFDDDIPYCNRRPT